MTEQRKQFWVRHFARQLLADQGQAPGARRSRFEQLLAISRDEKKNAKFERLMGGDWMVEVSKKAVAMRRDRA